MSRNENPSFVPRLGFWLCLLIAAPSGAFAAPAPTFTKNVAPILYKHCANCHRPGENASSISFLSYASTQPWANSIKETVLHGEMPPWPADSSASAKFRNDPRLSQREIDILVAWVNAGALKGNAADSPPVPHFPTGWLNPNGKPPDLVITLPLYHLPATGELPYVRYLAKVPFDGDKWIAALQVRPGNNAVVHHMAITEVALPKGTTPADLDEAEKVAKQMGMSTGTLGIRPAVHDPVNPIAYDMFAVYTPGTTFEMYPDGAAKLLRGGDNMYLNFNIHYQTTGKVETDRPTLGLWFLPGPPKHQLFRVPASAETVIVNGKELLTDAPGQKAEGTNVVFPPIPPGADNYEVIGITAYTDPVTVYQFQPHAHLRGKDFKYAVVYPDGHEETLLTVPKYNFHWQLAYDLEKPLQLPAGSKLVVTAHYDNSARNEPMAHHHGAGAEHVGTEKEVVFRESNQSWDEMFTPFIQYSIDSGSATSQAVSLKIVSVAGCLQQGPSSSWMLTSASDPDDSPAQNTTSSEVAEAAKVSGERQYQLLGVNAFNPSNHKGQRVAVKGVLIPDGKSGSVNVTSLQRVEGSCP